MDRLCSIALALFLTAACLLPAWSQEDPPAPVAPPEEEMAEDAFAMPVVVDGEELFLLRGSSALPAGERVAVVAERIIEAADASEDSSVVIEIRPNEFGLAIYVDGFPVNVTTEADAELEQMSLDVLAELQANAIEQAILTYRQSRSEEARVQSAAQAAGWTLGFAAVFFALWRLRKWLPDHVAKRVEQRFARVEEATNAIVRGRAVAALIRFLLRLTIVLLLFVIFYYYVSLVLLSFAETRPIANLLLTYVTGPILDVLGGFVAYIPNLLTLAVIALLTNYLIRGAKLFFQNVETGTIRIRDFQPHWIWPTYNIIRGVLILLAIVLAFPYIPGSDSAAFQGVTILVGIMVSLGSNSVVANLLSGLFVIYRRSTNIGDRIRVGEHVGDVVQIKLMETHLKSIKNELISIPNAQLLNSDVVNYTSMIDGRGLMIHTEVGIGYEEPQAKVEAMLIEAANRTKNLKQSPAPFVLRKALSDYAVTYEINAFTTRGNKIPQLLSELHSHILDIFHANGVQIMTPSYEGDPEDLKIPPTNWDGKLVDSPEA